MNQKSRKRKAETITLTEKHLFRKDDPAFRELDDLTFRSKNLYNSTLYAMRQYFFEHRCFPGYRKVNADFTHENQPDYRALPAKVAKHVQMMADEACRSFLTLNALHREGKLQDRPKLPGYMDKTKGRQVLHYEKGAISRPWLQKGIIHLSGTELYIPTGADPAKVQFVRIVPAGGAFAVEVGYREELPELKEGPSRIAALDLGVNNLAVCCSNVSGPVLIDGKYLKSINQRSNKAIAKAKAEARKKNGQNMTVRIRAMYLRRNNRILDYMHKATRYLVNHFVSSQIDTVVIGHSKGWKQDTDMGKRTNQNFCQIPFNMFISMLCYKCRMAGIRAVCTEESYTSKCSFLDDEECRKHKEYMGRRVHRGLFRSHDGTVINADLNGSLNILKKEMQKMDAWNDTLYRQCVEHNLKTDLVRYKVPRS
jgi:putative transposase